MLASYVTITLGEQYRLCRSGVIHPRYIPTYGYLILMAIMFGGVGMWCMHFIGMSSIKLYNPHSGELIHIHYDIGVTIASLITILALSLAGFYVCSRDIMFSKTKSEIIDTVVAGMETLSLRQIKKMKNEQIIVFIATRKLGHLFVGGLLLATGVISMHYIGMHALHFHGVIEWDYGLVVASVILGLISTWVSPWILFRLLSIYPQSEILRVTGAFAMTCGLAGMHYAGMMAARFHYEEDGSITSSGINKTTDHAFVGALIAASACIFVAVTVSLSDIRFSINKLSVELNRADDLIVNLSLRPGSSAATNVHHYLSKRRKGNFNLSAIEGTKFLLYKDNDDDSGSESSSNGGPSVAGSAINSGLNTRYRKMGRKKVYTDNGEEVYMDVEAAAATTTAGTTTAGTTAGTTTATTATANSGSDIIQTRDYREAVQVQSFQNEHEHPNRAEEGASGSAAAANTPAGNAAGTAASTTGGTGGNATSSSSSSGNSSTTSDDHGQQSFVAQRARDIHIQQQLRSGVADWTDGRDKDNTVTSTSTAANTIITTATTTTNK